MTAVVEARKPMDGYALAHQIETFISDNKHSNRVEDRWLANLLTEPLRVVRMRNNGLDEASKVAIAKFRVAEIEDEKRKKLREIDTLEAEARKLNAA